MPYFLGRKPSPPDERDWNLSAFLGDDGSLRDAAVAELKLTTVGYKNHSWTIPPAGTHWARAFALLAQIGSAPPPPPPVVEWQDNEPVLDQGAFGTCIGNGFAQFGNTLPIDDRFNETDARAIYYEATVLDGAPDNPDSPGGGQQGATVRSGVKAMQARGRINAYAFAATVQDAIVWIETKGPVVFGTDWFEGMFDVDATGLVHPTGAVAGGHCYLGIGYDIATSRIRCLNSWGSGWGQNGRFDISKIDMEKVFKNQGEAVAAVELP